MPLKWVLHWHPNPGNAVNSQTLAEVSQCIQTLNGVKEGRWKASLTFYKPISRDSTIPSDLPRDLIGITLPEQPSKYYFTLRSHRIVLEADLSIQNIMEKLQSYKARVVLNFEGFQYQLGDFQLRVGKVVTSHSENLRGIVMEVEYLPISSLEKSRRIMEEFIDIWQEVLSKRSLPGHFVHAEPNFSEYGLSDHYSSQHTAVQYATSVAQESTSTPPPLAQAVTNLITMSSGSNLLPVDPSQTGEGLVHQPLEPAKAMPYSSMIAPNIDFGGYMQSCRKLTLQTRGVNSNIGIKSVKLEPQHYGDLVPFREC